MYLLFYDALIDSLKMLPFLFFIYIGIEVIESKLSDRLINRVKHAGKIAPAMGAAFGIVPQCGFSVMATALYTKKIITIGTLLAVYISTSDEALPVILSQPDKAGIIAPLIITKIFLAIIAGYFVDLFLQRALKFPAEGELCATSEEFHLDDSHEEDLDEKGCCGHDVHPNKLGYRELIVHPLIHTLKVFVFIFAATLLLNFIIFRIGENNLSNAFLGHTIFQPIIASLVGLIPNCAASIAITQLFLKGGISFGSTIAGLSAGAGLGVLVLIKENANLKDTAKVILLLVSISSIAGIIIQYVYG